MVRVTGLVVMALVLAAPVGRAASDLMTELVEPYLLIQSALVNDNLEPVEVHAKQVEVGARSLGDAGQAMEVAARKLAAADSLDAARAAFAELSDALIAYADDTDMAIADHMVAYCPMAQHSWVQTGTAVANPFYGAAMRTCGEIQRGIGAPKQ